jgi:hypothetical protein
MNDAHEFATRTPAQVVLAIFDKLRIKLSQVNLNYDFYE